MMKKEAWRKFPLRPEYQPVLDKMQAEFQKRGMQVQMEAVMTPDKIVIYIVSPYFADIPDMNKMQGAWAVADAVLEPEEKAAIAYIACWTPEQFEGMKKIEGEVGQQPQQQSPQGELPLSQGGNVPLSQEV